MRLTRARDARGFEDDPAGANPSSVVMNINESHYSAIPWDKEGQGSRGVSGGPAQGGDVGTTMETQCPVEDPATERRKPSLCRVGTASARARTPFRLRDGWTFDKTRPHVCRIEDVCCPLMTCTASEHTAHRMTVHTLPDTGRPRRERPRRFRWLDSQVVSRSAPPSPWVAGP